MQQSRQWIVFAGILLAGISFGADLVDGQTFEERCREAITLFSNQPVSSKWNRLKTGKDAAGCMKWHLYPLAARLAARKDLDTVVPLYMRGLELCDNTRDAPWSTIRSLCTTLLNRDVLPPDAMEKQKELLQRWNYNCSAGTINMRLYLYVAGYLASEIWPDFHDSAVPVDTDYAIDFRGRQVRSHNATEIHEFCREKIEEIFRLFVLRNQVEHSQVYFMCDVEAVKMLADFAKAPEMRRRATMVMDYFMLNLATDWNQGVQVEPFFRNKYLDCLMDAKGGRGQTESVGWLYFGAPRPIALKELPPFFCHQGYRLPPVFGAIARDRSGIREKTETGFFGEKEIESANYKTFFHTPTYSLASAVCDYDGKKGIRTVVFKEQRMVNLTWMSETPGSRFYVFQENYKQPYFNKFERNMTGSGENPYGQRFQHKRTVIGLYSVPETYEFYKQYTAYSRTGAILKRQEKDGWVFCHAGGMLFAFYSMAPTTWEYSAAIDGAKADVDLRWCDSRENAWVLETADVSRYSGTVDEQLDAFAGDILSNSVVDVSGMKNEDPEFRYKTIYGDQLRIVLATLGQSQQNRHFVNGRAIDYSRWKMLDSPWAQQGLNSPRVTVDFAGTRLVYDFEKWTVSGDRRTELDKKEEDDDKKSN